MNARARALRGIEAYVRRHASARLQMTLIVVATGLAAFLASASLLALGVSSLPLRYGASVALAYGVFLLLVRAWVEVHRRGIDAGDVVDALVDPLPDVLVEAGRAPFSMGGGSFGGGGAGGSWADAVPVRGIAADAACADVTPVSRVASSSADVALKTSRKASSKLADLLDPDDGWLIVVPIAIALAAAAWAIWIAPALLAEVLLDVLVVSALYRKLRGVEPRSWLTGAVRRTWPAAAAIAVVAVLGGFVLQRAVPEADSIGDVFVQGRRG